MGAGNWPGLAGGVSPDPWVERDRLTSGQPEAIHGLAGAFESAAREAASATEAGARASLQTGEAYRVDGNEVHAVNAESGRTRQLLGGGGEDLERIGRILRGIGDDLSAKSGTAVQKVLRLEEELRTLQNTFQQYEATYRAERANASFLEAAVLDTRYVAEQAAFRARSTDAAQRTGREIQDLVSEYDGMLGGRSGELAELGYTVPGGVNQGPGDVESDPNAGRSDAQTVAEALDLDPGRQSLAEIDAAMGQIRAINEKVANGEPLTQAEQDYLNQFYDTLGADDLARLPDYLQEAAPHAADNRRGPDGYPMSSAQDVYDRALQPFGDSIMNLSNVPGATYESLPAPVRDLLDTRLGHVDPNTDLRHLNPRMLNPSGYPEGSNPTAYMLGGGVTGMDRFRSITDILNSSDAAPGDKFAEHLADTAIRARQDLNDAQWMAQQGHFRDTGDNFANGVSALVEDSAASDLLSLAARNNDASSGVLLGEDRRAAILGLNWEDATGATDLVRAGTERDPAEGGGTMRQAEAALAVVQEVGNDRGIIRTDDQGNVLESTGYLGRMVDPMKATVNDVGLQYIEAFAEPHVDASEATNTRTDALGKSLGPSFELTADDRDHFLQFVAGTGEDRAAEFQQRAQVWGQSAVADALSNGTSPTQVTRAMEMAGRLDGAVSQANFDYRADQVAGNEAAAATHAGAVEARATQGTLNTVAVAGKEIAGLLAQDVIDKIPGGSALLSIITEAGKGGIGMATMPPSAQASQLPENLDDMRRTDGQWATQQQNYMLAGAMEMAGLFDDSSRPPILTHDENNDGNPDPRSDSENMSSLRGDLTDAWNRWRAEHGVAGEVDDLPATYLQGRSQSFTGTHDGAGAPAESQWRDDRLYYGETMPSGGVIRREPDPRRLDDPAWTPPR